MKVVSIVPAYNEAERIADTVRAALNLSGIAQVIVVDDGSTDETARIAEQAGASVVRQVRNGGKAKAMEAGAEAATDADALLFLDADLARTANEATALIEPVLNNRADMTIATFPVKPGRGGGMGIVVRLSRAGIQALTGRTMQAPLSGQRCITRAAFQAARPLASGFGVETGMTIDILRAGFRVLEVATTMDHRVTGRDFRAQLHRARQLKDVAKALLTRLGGRRR